MVNVSKARRGYERNIRAVHRVEEERRIEVTVWVSPSIRPLFFSFPYIGALWARTKFWFGSSPQDRRPGGFPRPPTRLCSIVNAVSLRRDPELDHTEYDPSQFTQLRIDSSLLQTDKLVLRKKRYLFFCSCVAYHFTMLWSTRRCFISFVFVCATGSYSI